MAQMNGMEKRNFTKSARNGGKTAEMRNNSAKSGMVGMSAYGSAIGYSTICWSYISLADCLWKLNHVPKGGQLYRSSDVGFRIIIFHTI